MTVCVLYVCGPGFVTVEYQVLNHRRMSQVEMGKRGKLRALVDRSAAVDIDLRQPGKETAQNYYDMQMREIQLRDCEVRRAVQRFEMVSW